MNGSDTFRVNSPSVISEAVDGETVAINLQNGVYYSFNKSASYAWHLLGCLWTPDEIAATLAEKGSLSADVAKRDVTTFVALLLAEGLICLEGGDRQNKQEPALDLSFVDYIAPAFEKFDDLSALLLADPIHDVGEAGWPHVKSPDLS